MSDVLRAKLDALPAEPGVYLFRGSGGTCLYVGKAANLRSRVRSYFQASSSDTRMFIVRLEREVAEIETVITSSEKEAALLENSLIKEHRPRYNFKLRDDKDFLSLRLDRDQRWPRLEVVRRPKKDGAQYFGPYPSASAARSTLRTVNRHFQLRTCTDSELRSRTRPCLQYQIKRCLAPCVFEVDPGAYAKQLRNVGLFLDGRHDELINRLETQMRQASHAMSYELAATYRDQLRAVTSIREQQRVALVSDIDQDVFGLCRLQEHAELAVLLVRRGKVVTVRTYGHRHVQIPDDELVASFVREYYGRGSAVPNEILLPVRVEAETGLAQMLSQQRAARVRVLRPERGAKARLLKMAMENAAHACRERLKAGLDVETQLQAVQQRLGLTRLPRQIECLDVSHSAGTDTVAAIVALKDAAPARAHYRSFHLRLVQGGDDYGAMREVLTRRFKRGGESQPGWEPPDLLVLDGGRGQLGVAKAVLAELEIEGVELAALAKERVDAKGHSVLERVYRPGRKNSIELSPGPGALRMLLLARDEAHRVSNRLRIRLGKRRKLRSGLLDVPGVGTKTSARLLRELGSLRAVSSASVEQLMRAGLGKKQAAAVHDYYHGEGVEAEPEHQAGLASTATSPDAGSSTDSEAGSNSIEGAVLTDEAEDRAVDNAFEL